MKLNQLKHRLMAAVLSCILMAGTMSMPAYAMDIEEPINQKETVQETLWDILEEVETESNEIALRPKQTKYEKSTSERIVNIMQEEEEEAVEEVVNYIPRLEAPDGYNPYYHELNLYYRFGLGMPNCTAYAYGRAYEILGREPMLCNGNAGEWWSYNIAVGAYAYGSEPRLGAIACWDDYNHNSGHVAVVEEIHEDTVTISESQWGGSYFYVVEMSKNGSDYLSGRRFLGYIYIDEAL